MEGTSDDEVKWDLQSSGDEGGASAEAPAVVHVATPTKSPDGCSTWSYYTKSR